MITFDKVRCGCLAIDSLEIPEGITSVIGRNGSGKTTLLRACAGLLLPEEGAIRIDGALPRETETGWVNEFPDRNLLFGRVSDEVASPLRFRQVPCSMTDERVRRQLSSMGLLHLENRSTGELSGGEKILVALAAALIHGPRLLVLDEYDSHLDAGTVSRIEEVIRAGCVPYTVRCTQQMETAAAGDHVVCMENGRVISAGTPEEVFSSLENTPFYPLAWRLGHAGCP